MSDVAPQNTAGKVYLRSKVNHRARPTDPHGVPHAEPPYQGTAKDRRILNVTSVQPRLCPGRVAFSPMHVFNGPYKAPDGFKYACYEHYWQSLKHFPGRNHAADKAWWRKQTAAKRRLPKVPPNTCLYASDETRFPGQTFQYVDSRKVFYVTDYRAKITGDERAQALIKEHRRMLAKGMDIIVEDFDGPRDNVGRPLIEEVTKELLRDKLHDTAFPFGHGYLVAAEILGIEPSQYTE